MKKKSEAVRVLLRFRCQVLLCLPISVFQWWLPFLSPTQIHFKGSMAVTNAPCNYQKKEKQVYRIMQNCRQHNNIAGNKNDQIYYIKNAKIKRKIQKQDYFWKYKSLWNEKAYGKINQRENDGFEQTYPKNIDYPKTFGYSDIAFLFTTSPPKEPISSNPTRMKKTTALVTNPSLQTTHQQHPHTKQQVHAFYGAHS